MSDCFFFFSILMNYAEQSHFVTLQPLSHWLVWLFPATLFLIIPGLMNAMVTVTWRREAVIAASVRVELRLVWITFRGTFSACIDVTFG